MKWIWNVLFLAVAHGATAEEKQEAAAQSAAGFQETLALKAGVDRVEVVFQPCLVQVTQHAMFDRVIVYRASFDGIALATPDVGPTRGQQVIVTFPYEPDYLARLHEQAEAVRQALETADRIAREETRTDEAFAARMLALRADVEVQILTGAFGAEVAGHFLTSRRYRNGELVGHGIQPGQPPMQFRFKASRLQDGLAMLERWKRESCRED